MKHLIRIALKILLVLTGIAIVLYLAFEAPFAKIDVLDAIFVVGILLFFTGLLQITTVKNLFLGIRYSLRNIWVFRFHKVSAQSYSEYYQQMNRDKNSTYAIENLLIGSILIGVSLILSYQLMG